MTNEQIIEAAITELESVTGYHFSTDIIKFVVNVGLEVDTEKPFHLGSGIFLTIKDGEFTGSKEGKELNRGLVSNLNPAQKAAMLKAKAKHYAQK